MIDVNGLIFTSIFMFISFVLANCASLAIVPHSSEIIASHPPIVGPVLFVRIPHFKWLFEMHTRFGEDNLIAAVLAVKHRNITVWGRNYCCRLREGSGAIKQLKNRHRLASPSSQPSCIQRKNISEVWFLPELLQIRFRPNSLQV